MCAWCGIRCFKLRASPKRDPLLRRSSSRPNNSSRPSPCVKKRRESELKPSGKRLRRRNRQLKRAFRRVKRVYPAWRTLGVCRPREHSRSLKSQVCKNSHKYAPNRLYNKEKVHHHKYDQNKVRKNLYQNQNHQFLTYPLARSALLAVQLYQRESSQPCQCSS